jgi:parallel beta-helix repeat protein
MATFTVVNTNDDGLGSLRQAITDANNLDGADTIAFSIPTSDPNFVTAAGVDCDLTNNGIPDTSPCWWRIPLSSPLPALTDSDTEIVGQTQTLALSGDTNPGVVGTVIDVGVDAVALTQKSRPEVAIDGNGFDAFTIDGDATGIVIQGLAIYNASTAIRVTTGAGPISHPVAAIGNMLVGVMPNGEDPGMAERNTGSGIALDDRAQVTVTNSYIAFNGAAGITGARNESVLHLLFNEVFGNGWNATDRSGIELNGIDSDVRFNFSHDNTNNTNQAARSSGHGIALASRFALDSPAGHARDNILVENNTVMDNISAGIAIRDGAIGSTIRKNVVTENSVGVFVNIESATQTENHVITRNSIFGNGPSSGSGGLGIDLQAITGAAPVYDGVTQNDQNDADGGSNNRANFPVVTSAHIWNGNLILTGFAEPGTLIEFFVADPDPSGFGEGKTFVAALTEGSADDSGTGTGSYGPQVNGRTVSAVAITANRFSFSLPLAGLPAAIGNGTVLTATGTVAEDTSEFSPLVSVHVHGALSGFVYTDRDNDGIKEAGETGIEGVTVELEGMSTEGESVERTTTTAADGSYSFEDLPAGTYAINESQPANFFDGRDTIGTQGGSVANDRFFDITLDAGENGVENNFAELAPASLSGLVFRDADNDGVRDGGENSIGAVTIRLTGIDDRANVVDVTVQTSAQVATAGEYRFDNLRPGVYEIREEQPTAYADGEDSVGTLGGTATNDRISGIPVVPGATGTGYNFGELELVPVMAEHTFRIFPGTEQRIQVQVLGGGDINVNTVRLGNASVIQSRRRDVNGDGQRDLSLFFRARDTGLVPGATAVRLIGQLNDGTFFARDFVVETLVFEDVRVSKRVRAGRR